MRLEILTMFVSGFGFRISDFIRMLDIKFIRQNPEKVKEGLRKKQIVFDLDHLLEVDKKRLELLQAQEDLNGKKNRANEAIQKANDEREKQTIILQMRELDENDDRIRNEFKAVEQEFNDLMFQIPNLPFDDAPEGKDESENVLIKQAGEPGKFDFEPKDCMEIGRRLDLIDTERAAKVSGSRFGYIKKEAVLLEFALINLAFDVLAKEGFTPIIPPVLINPEAMRGMGYIDIEKDKIERYFLDDDQLYLAGTSEQSIGPMRKDEILEEKDLPLRYAAFSSCFRREAGSYGKDTKGILRVHQFDKVEMFSFCLPEKSVEEHKFLLSMEEKLMRLLEIPYRVVQLCTGDLARPSGATFDIEAWLPGQNQYRETHSTSNCADFQARRLNIRYRSKNGLDFVHTLNGTAFAIGRTIIAILENYQQKDGTVKVPEVLQKYLHFKTISRK